MSVNRNRSKTKMVCDNHSYRLINLNEEFPPYWDEGINFYSRHNRICNDNLYKKRIMSYQRRMYRTWKHNRNTQYKN